LPPHQEPLQTEAGTQHLVNTIDSFLKERGLSKVNSDPCIYIYLSPTGKAIIFLYVNDLLIAASLSLLDSIKQMLHQRFRMKDLGDATSLKSSRIDSSTPSLSGNRAI